MQLGFYRGHPVLGDVFDWYYGQIDRIAIVMSFLEASLHVPGDVAEFGAHRGHAAVAMSRTLERQRSEKQLYLFDSFAGMTETSHPPGSTSAEGDLADPLEKPQGAVSRDSPSGGHCFRATSAKSLPEHPDLRFCFCHVNSDLYASVKECIAYILPRLGVGGVIVFDDYGFRDTAGARAAVDERLGGELRAFIPLPTGQAVYFARPGDSA